MADNIYEFDPVIYPVKLWVSIAGDLVDMRSKLARYPSRKELSTKLWEESDAFVDTAMSKENMEAGILVAFRDIDACTIGIIAHECTHVSARVWRYIGESEWGNEANAYLVEWIAKCIESVKNKNTNQCH